MKHPGHCAPFSLHGSDLFRTVVAAPPYCGNKFTVLPCASGTKDCLFFPSKPGPCPCHWCPLLPILWRIMNSHYIKFNGPLQCPRSITPFHSKSYIYLFSLCSTDCFPFSGTDCLASGKPSCLLGDYPSYRRVGLKLFPLSCGDCVWKKSTESLYLTLPLPRPKQLILGSMLTAFWWKSACRSLHWFIMLLTLSTACCFQPPCFLACAARTNGFS